MVQIDPLDYATRAHEILEDAVRDQLSGTDALERSRGAGHVGRGRRHHRGPQDPHADPPVPRGHPPDRQRRHGDVAHRAGRHPARPRRHHPHHLAATQDETERLDASLGQALEGLSQAPGAATIPLRSCPRSLRRHQDRPISRWTAVLLAAGPWSPERPARLWPPAPARPNSRNANRPADDPGGAVAGSDLSATGLHGVDQSGILDPAPAHAMLVAFDSMGPTRSTSARAPRGAQLSGPRSAWRARLRGRSTPLRRKPAPWALEYADVSRSRSLRRPPSDGAT